MATSSRRKCSGCHRTMLNTWEGTVCPTFIGCKLTQPAHLTPASPTSVTPTDGDAGKEARMTDMGVINVPDSVKHPAPPPVLPRTSSPNVVPIDPSAALALSGAGIGLGATPKAPPLNSAPVPAAAPPTATAQVKRTRDRYWFVLTLACVISTGMVLQKSKVWPFNDHSKKPTATAPSTSVSGTRPQATSSTQPSAVTSALASQADACPKYGESKPVTDSLLKKCLLRWARGQVAPEFIKVSNYCQPGGDNYPLEYTVTCAVMPEARGNYHCRDLTHHDCVLTKDK